MLFRKKPVTIEAHRWWANGDHPDDCVIHDEEGELVRFYRHPDHPGHEAHDRCGLPWHEHGWIDTLEGGHTVCPGDWIITGVQGEHYPCKPDIFADTYEPVGDGPPAEPTGRDPRAGRPMTNPVVS